MTIEAQCASCSHRSVCSKMDEYTNVMKRLSEVLSEFTGDVCKIELKCRYYAADERIHLTNTLTGHCPNVLSQTYYTKKDEG